MPTDAPDVDRHHRLEAAWRLDEARLETLVQLNQMTDAPTDEIVSFALEEAVRLTNSKISYIAFLSEDERWFTSSAWSRTTLAECALPAKPPVYEVANTGLWGEVVRQRRPTMTNDYAAPDPAKKGLPAGHLPLRCHMNVPVFEGSRIVAVAGVANKPVDYDDADVRQLTLLMAGVWQVFRRNRAEQAVNVRARQQEAVACFGLEALKGTGLPDLMEACGRVVAETLDVEYSKVLELLPGGSSFLLRAGVGWQGGCVGRVRLSTGAESQAGYTLLSSEPIIVEDLPGETRFRGPQLLLDHGVISGMSVIIHGRDKPFGVLGAHTKRRRQFSTDDIHFLQAMANVLAEAVERQRTADALRQSDRQLRTLAARLETVREEERTHIAREIHDELGQQLTACKIDLAWLCKAVTHGKPGLQPLIPKKITALMDLTEAIVASVRRIATDLRPAILDDLGLVAAIEWQTQQFTTQTEIQCDLALGTEEVSLDTQRATAVFRIYQEILTNIARHAGATRVSVRLVASGYELVLAVQDNGRGITPEELNSPLSLGLLGMRERVRSLGGDVTFAGAEGQGTTITVVIPLAQQECV